MPYVKVSRPPNAVPDAVAWRTLGVSRATFFRKLKEGTLTAPITRIGTSRRNGLEHACLAFDRGER